jgi:FtsP/CotA-like multicopper oxidase with cupredoxin domain
MTITTDESLADESRASELAALEERLERDRTRRDGWTLFVFTFAAFAVVASVVGVGFALRAIDQSEASGSSDSGAVAVPVTLSEFAIEPSTIEVASGGALQVTNTGSVAHNVRIEDTDLATPDIPAGASESLDVSALAPGSYTVICTIAGHESAGMTAQLIVGASGASGSTDHSAHGGSAADGAMTAEQMDAMMAAVTHAFPAATEGKGAQLLPPTVLADGTKQFELTTSIVKWEVEPGKFVDAWAYNGQVPGPTIKVETGDKVRVVLHNELPESTAIHWHGILVPNAMDGVPDITQPPVKPGESFTYEFVARESAVGMYHSHHNSAKQVANGLAGAFLVDRLPMPDGLPVDVEYPMMLNDSGTIGYSLNGKSFPATEPVVVNSGERVLVHYLNEGVMAHPMHLHGMHGLVVAKDGMPLASPYEADTINIAPGERYSVLIEATEPGTWAWHCHILTHAETEEGMFGMVTAMIVR